MAWSISFLLGLFEARTMRLSLSFWMIGIDRACGRMWFGIEVRLDCVTRLVGHSHCSCLGHGQPDSLAASSISIREFRAIVLDAHL